MINVIVFGVVVLMVRRRAIVAPGLCADHKKRQRRAVMLTWTGILLGLVLLYVGAASPLGFWGMMLGVLVLLGSIVAGMLFARVVYANRIDKTYVRLKGCGDPVSDGVVGRGGCLVTLDEWALCLGWSLSTLFHLPSVVHNQGLATRKERRLCQKTSCSKVPSLIKRTCSPCPWSISMPHPDGTPAPLGSRKSSAAISHTPP